MKKTLLSVLMFCLCSAAFAASVITSRPDDAKAIYLDAPAAKADSSAALQAAIDKAASTGREGIVFVAAGRYTLTRTIYVWPGVRLIGYGATRPIFVLPPQTPGFQKGMGVMVMFTGLAPNELTIGLHPTLTQIDLLDETPGYEGIGAPKPVILASAGGENILSGIGVFTGGINPRAVAVLWKAGEQSLIDDVRFLGGHGSGTNPYNNNHTADSDLRKRWDSQYPSLWIADGGGGTFADIWTPNTFAQAGFVVSNTKTPGHVYGTRRHEPPGSHEVDGTC